MLSTISNYENGTRNLIQPDQLLPNQMQGASAEHRTGEAALLWAVLTDGIQTFCDLVLNHQTKSPEFREVERWVLRSEPSMLTSFDSLCALFDLDSRRLRLRLLDVRERPSTLHVDAIRLEVAA